MNLLSDAFETSSGLVIPRTESMEIIRPGTFTLDSSYDRDEELERIVVELEALIRQIEVCFIHCFDGRPFWRMLWRAIIMVIEAEKVLRLSLAGATANTEIYLSYLERLRRAFNRIKELSSILHVVITHSPCARFHTKTRREIALKGTILARKILDSGRPSFAMHLHLDTETGLLDIEIDDYDGITKTDPMAKRIMVAANTAVLQLRCDQDGLKDLPDLQLVSATVAMGYPPTTDDPTLVLCEVDPGEIRKSKVAGKRLKGKAPTVDPIAFWFNQN